MPKCSSCSAPLPKSGIICQYCGTRNDIDLKDFKVVEDEDQQKRVCPTCHTNMSTIDIGKEYKFLIQRCETCYGVFFDHNELENMVQTSINGSKNIDLIKLSQITENPRHIDIIVYKKCPICNKHMHRKNYKKRSGVITDICSQHGVWLDSGELRQILEWTKTGGEERIKQEKSSISNRHKNFNNSKYKRDNYKDESTRDSEKILNMLDNIFFSGWNIF